jgi:hypothetical protein
VERTQIVGTGFGGEFPRPIDAVRPIAVGGTAHVTFCDGTPIDDGSVVSLDPAVVETLPFGELRGVSAGDSSLEFAIASERRSFISVGVAVREIASAAIFGDFVYFRGRSAHVTIELTSADGLRLVDESMRWIAPESGEPYSSFWTDGNWDRWTFIVPDTDGFDVEIESGAGERFVAHGASVDTIDEIVLGGDPAQRVLRKDELHLRCYLALSRGRTVFGAPFAISVRGPVGIQPSPLVDGAPGCVILTANEVGSATIEVRAPGAMFVDNVEVQ